MNTINAGADTNMEDDAIRQLVEKIVVANCIDDSLVYDALDRIDSRLKVVRKSAIRMRDANIGARFKLAHVSGSEIVVERFQREGQLIRFTVQFNTLSKENARPYLLAIADSNCRIQSGRKLHYFPDGMVDRVEQLDNVLLPTGVSGLLNPPVPKFPDPGGLLVGLVDSGVNYLLLEINQRLARNSNGELLGFDYWEMDHRPFDAHLVRSPFFVRRHGTRTADLLLREAPIAKLVVYRYPRPKMTRMTNLIEDAASKDIRIINLSMGSTSREEWAQFRQHAEKHPEILFVVSAGNDGRNIDDRPVYPAALQLENIIVVTSANDDGSLARGSNWGVESVDLMVPAENIPLTGFDGFARLVSGSSYAAPRVSALAACLLEANPHWSTPELKLAIFSLADKSTSEVSKNVKVGFVQNPVFKKRGNCEAESAQVEIRKHTTLDIDQVAIKSGNSSKSLKLSAVMVSGTGWTLSQVNSILDGAAEIISQCDIRIDTVEIQQADVPTRLKYFSLEWSEQLAEQISLSRPTVFFVKDTVDADAFEALAISRSNSRSRPSLTNSVWMMKDVSHPNVSLAHELVHVLLDGGDHSSDVKNLMNQRTSQEGWHLSKSQCQRIRNRSTEVGLLR